MAEALVKANFIDIEMQRRIKQVYHKLSHVVHGKACSRTFAKNVIAQTGIVLADMGGGVLTGHSTPAPLGGAS